MPCLQHTHRLATATTPHHLWQRPCKEDGSPLSTAPPRRHGGAPVPEARSNPVSDAEPSSPVKTQEEGSTHLAFTSPACTQTGHGPPRSRLRLRPCRKSPPSSRSADRSSCRPQLPPPTPASAAAPRPTRARLHRAAAGSRRGASGSEVAAAAREDRAGEQTTGGPGGRGRLDVPGEEEKSFAAAFPTGRTDIRRPAQAAARWEEDRRGVAAAARFRRPSPPRERLGFFFSTPRSLFTLESRSWIP
jgi:hypothetical protein